MDERNKGRGDADAAGQCVARPRGGGVAVNRCTKSLLDLRRRAGELDPTAACGQGRNGETLLGEPRGDGGNIGSGVGEFVGKLRGREPLVIRAIAGKLLILEERIERLLLRRRRLKQEEHAIETRAGRCNAEIVAGGNSDRFAGFKRDGCARVPVAGKSGDLNGTGGARSLCFGRRDYDGHEDCENQR